jgi:hypothetical protein
MAIIIETVDPHGLLKMIYKGIDDKDIRTWARIEKSQKLTHVTASGQYEHLAAFTPKAVTDATKLTFLIDFPEDIDPDKARGLYAIYHGRFMEMLLAHFYNHFSALAASSKPKLYDVMTPEIRAVLSK